MPNTLRAALLVLPLLLSTNAQTTPTPPRIVVANIVPGTRDANSETPELVLRFDQPMKPGGTLVKVSDATDPHFGAGAIDETGYVLSVPVQLAPHHDYEYMPSNLVSVAGVAFPAMKLGFRTANPWSGPRVVKPVEGIVYDDIFDVKRTMDYYAPAGPGPHPAIILIHGGGFTLGTSRNGSEAYCADFLAPAGYAVFSINYRMYPRFTLADMVDDVHRAVRFVRHNAKRWNVDPNKIALLGGSAGGYLSNIAGVTASTAGRFSRRTPLKDPVQGASANVQAVVTLYGLSDAQGMMTRGNGAFKAMFGDWSVERASPIAHVNEMLPPFLLIHGEKDEAVPLTQSTNFKAALDKAGVRCDLITIPGGAHGTMVWHTLANVPAWEKRTIEWLNEVLGYKGPSEGTGIRARGATR